VCLALTLLAFLLIAMPEHTRVDATSKAGARAALQQAIRQNLAASPLVYHGGPVQRNPVSYLIFWGAGWDNGTGGLTTDGQIVKKYFDNVGGTNYFKTLTQYWDFNGAIAPDHTLGGWLIDSSGPATDATCGGPTVEDSAVQAEVSHAIAAAGWPSDSANATYYVFTPPGMAVNDGQGACSERHFCDYHNWSTMANAAYAAVPYPTDLTACGTPSSPNGSNTGDSLAGLASQAQFGAITDPQGGSGWLDSAGVEIAGKCRWDFSKGPVILANNSVFELQSAYSNANSACATNFTSQTLFDGLRGYWKFDETAAWTNDCATLSVLDSSGNHLDGKSCRAGSGPTSAVAGRLGSARSFSGTNAFVSLANTATLNFTANQDFSYSLWFKRSGSATGSFLLAKGAGTIGDTGYALVLSGGATPLAELSKPGETGRLIMTGPAINDTNWHNIVVTYQRNGSGVMYIDGVQRATQSVSGYNVDLTNTRSLALGCYSDGSACFTGLLDDVRLYGRTLSAQEVSQLALGL
jgi:hypothetical protein